MMKFFLNIFFFCFVCLSFSQDKRNKSLRNEPNDSITKAKITQYAIITIDKDTSFVDTSLTIFSDYKHNYLKKDSFGTLAFANDGSYFNILDFQKITKSIYPEMGFSAKHQNYIQKDDVRYFHVATPLTDLHFKTTQQQGQNTDVLITINTSKQFNLSVEYRGIRSLGKYINEQSSSGNFKITSSYSAINKRYFANFHFTGQDLSNGENGGLTDVSFFETENPDYTNRARLQVFLKDAKTLLNGKRFFYDHQLRINAKDKHNNIYLAHQVIFETKKFTFNQNTVTSSIDGSTNFFNRFGNAYLSSNINDVTKYNSLYNKVGISYQNNLLGKITFFLEDYRNNQFYNNILQLDTQFVPNLISNTIQSVGAQYQYVKPQWNANIVAQNALTNSQIRSIDASLKYKFNDTNNFQFQYNNSTKAPNNSFNLLQSSYIDYNWSNSFSNTTSNAIQAAAFTKFLNANFKAETIDNFLYFKDISTTTNQQTIRPFQYNSTIKYLAASVQKEIKYYKFGLESTILYQKVDQKDPILNLPELTLRATLFYQNKFFKKNLQLQTGFTINYFTAHYANDFNPIVSEFFVQNTKQIGNYPMIDFFVNGRIRQTRIFFKAEHFNSSFTGNSFYTTPNLPYRDFLIRFGIAWNFFQ